MWCEDCKADVAAEYSPSDRILRCATCGTSLESTHLKRGTSADEARSLLERWSDDALLSPPRFEEEASKPVEHAVLEPDAEVEPTREQSAAERSTQPSIEQPEEQDHEPIRNSPRRPKFVAHSRDRVEDEPERHDEPETYEEADVRPSRRRPHFRTDAAHSAHHRDESIEEPPRRRSAVLHGPHTSRRDTGRRRMRIDEYEDIRGEAPHFDTSGFPAIEPSRSSRWAVTLGQMLSYTGVLGLTCGTAFVIWSYFGGPAGYAPTGWIIMTAGQMMLFLGVVTLISGGMEQTTTDVRTRVEMLGDRLIRIEQATDHALRGPHTGSKPRKRRRQSAEVRERRSDRPRYRLDEVD